MPYKYPDDIPQFAINQSANVKKIVVRVFNETFDKTKSEQKARQAALAAMVNAREAESKIKVAKSVNQEKRIATFLVLEPQDDDCTTNDLHADWYDAELVEESCYNFNRFCMKANLFHRFHTDSIEFIESYITKSDMDLDEVHVKKGSWLATIYVKETELGENVWQGIKSGEFCGLSIQAMGSCEKLD